MSKRDRNRHLRTGQPQQTIVTTTHHQQVRIAPIPTPQELAQFEQVLPGLAERIMAQAELNGADRRKTNATIRAVTIMGQVFAFIIMMSALFGGFYLVHEGKNVAGIAAIVTAIAVPLGMFVYTQTRRPPQS